MSEQLIPFHKQAEDVGSFLVDARARDAEQDRRDEPATGPSENID